MNFPDWLQDQILRSGNTRKEIAKLAGMPKNEMDGICNGDVPKNHRLKGLAFALNLNVYEIEDALEEKEESNLEPVNSHPVADLKEVNEQTEKPGAKPKTAKIKNSTKRVHDLTPPKEKHCRHCDTETGTEAMRHSESRVIKFLDKGGIMGAKINDNLTAWLCFACDQKLSAPVMEEDPELIDRALRDHALAWSLAIIRTHLL